MKNTKQMEREVHTILNTIKRQGGLPRGHSGGTCKTNTAMCVEAVITLATENVTKDTILELALDSPVCVMEEIRMLSIRLNDAKWSSPYCRGEGMKRLAIAQLGSKEIDFDKWMKSFKERVKKHNIKFRDEKLDQSYNDFYDIQDFIRDNHSNNTLANIAEDMVQTLIEFDCPGTKFLHLIKE